MLNNPFSFDRIVQYFNISTTQQWFAHHSVSNLLSLLSKTEGSARRSEGESQRLVEQSNYSKARHGSSVSNRQGSHCIPRHNNFSKMKENNTKMKCVTLPLDVFSKFRSTDTEFAGEVFQYVLNYVVEGEQKHFQDPYKEMLFESLLEPIRPQMARYSERAEQCQVMARERKKSQKAIRKKNAKVIKNDDSVDGDNGIVATPDVSDKEADNNVTVQYGDVVKNNDDASDTDDKVTSSYDNVETAVEDVSFTSFMSIYEHQDKGGFDTESVWNRLNDAEKREAIRYARSYVQEVPDVAKREWPSKFISTRPWATNNK